MSIDERTALRAWDTYPVDRIGTLLDFLSDQDYDDILRALRLLNEAMNCELSFGEQPGNTYAKDRARTLADLMVKIEEARRYARNG
jgi:hypothetical protein